MGITFNNQILPNSCQLIGYSWLINHFNLELPLRQLCCISQKRLAGQSIHKGQWLIYDAQLMVEDIAYSHLEFALKHEYIDLLILKRIFQQYPLQEISQSIDINPKRILSKKIWFLYEFLLNKRLPLKDLPVGKYDDLLDVKKYIISEKIIKSKRHKINNNLIGTAKLCPIIRKTEKLRHYLDSNLNKKISNVLGSVSNSLIKRAASFLLLSDSKASFEIEGERPAKNRIESWGKIINEAGKTILSINEIQRLHSILLGNSRFIKIGLREEEVFLGDRDRDNYPIPEFIGANSKDILELMNDWIELEQKLLEDEIDPILHATIIAFIFVYVHPLEDGNGRIHRYLIHHVLANRNFYPKGMIFPISTVILDNIKRYRDILVQHTSPLMKMINWEATENGNVKILNNTEDLYRYFDATSSCEFIFACVEKTIKETLPNELKYLNSFDKAYIEINEIIEMPENKLKSLITYILQNEHKLSKNKKEKYFDELTAHEIKTIEDIVVNNFL
ncbi:cell filamentation protein Fic (plasmid) [Sulfurimonas aquatica]|uniref:Cell filamentation protein Fic n=1 Tax=Sulfurimonas aquatica TaxID=2672570 RepID=A0A975GE09_9BACT|nr:Fic family protein [Sulfurimonas aquatica]QSZ43162.1 cell filamentation protein Fic [Sulfurimonas aquatica]